MKIEQLYEDFNIDYATAGHKNVRDGWIGVDCPFCQGRHSKHLGYNLDGDYFHCWRCGGHQVHETLSKLLSISEYEAKELVKKYRGRRFRKMDRPKPEEQVDTKRRFVLPSGCGPLQFNHKQYLQSRGFDPDRLAKEWGLVGSGPMSKLEKADYKLRIIAPIFWDARMVSFQGRDITDRHPQKYKACPKDYEIIHHKRVLYGRQGSWGKTGLVVEGITDVWRLGTSAVGTFGIRFKPAQARIIATAFDRVFILFDPDPQAQQMARVMKNFLNEYDTEVEIITLEQDPGSMTQEEADYLTKQLIK